MKNEMKILPSVHLQRQHQHQQQHHQQQANPAQGFAVWMSAVMASSSGSHHQHHNPALTHVWNNVSDSVDLPRHFPRETFNFPNCQHATNKRFATQHSIRKQHKKLFFKATPKGLALNARW